MVRANGLNLFYESVENRLLCCRLRKVEPLRRTLADLDAWVTGLRRDQNVTRAETPKLEVDTLHGGIVKVNPIADWTPGQVTAYVGAHDVPTNRLHGHGYPSVGCAPAICRALAHTCCRSGWRTPLRPQTRPCSGRTRREHL